MKKKTASQTFYTQQASFEFFHTIYSVFNTHWFYLLFPFGNA